MAISNNRHVQIGGAELHIVLYCAGRNHKEYDIYLIKGSWPRLSSDELVRITEGGLASSESNGGVEVKDISPEHKSVKIFRR